MKPYLILIAALLGLPVAASSAETNHPAPELSTTRYEGHEVLVESRFDGYESLVDRDTTDGAPAYDYSINIIRTDENKGLTHRAFTGGRWKDRAKGMDGDHILQWKSPDGRPSSWEMLGNEPMFMLGGKEGFPDTWWASNTMDAEVLKAEDGKWVMMVQVMINPGRPIDIDGETADTPADRIMLLTADSLDGAWTKMTSRGVFTNISLPTRTKLHHPELIYVPWDPDGRKYWLYFALTIDKRFKGVYRVRSSDYRNFDYATRQRAGNVVGIGNQMGYLQDAPGGPLFVRITSTTNPEVGRKVPGIQLSRTGLSWTHPAALKLQGSSHPVNRNCYFSGLATHLGHGGLRKIGKNRWSAVYASTTSSSPVQPGIWKSEIGSGVMTIQIRDADPE